MKANVIYQSTFTSRQWRKVDGELQTKHAQAAMWHKAGWPEPEMTERDLDYYIERGEFTEVTD